MKTKITRSSDAEAQQQETNPAKSGRQNSDSMQEHCTQYSVVLLEESKG